MSRILISLLGKNLFKKDWKSFFNSYLVNLLIFQLYLSATKKHRMNFPSLITDREAEYILFLLSLVMKSTHSASLFQKGYSKLTNTLLQIPFPRLLQASVCSLGRSGTKSTLFFLRTPRGRVEITFSAKKVPLLVSILTSGPEQSILVTTCPKQISLGLSRSYICLISDEYPLSMMKSPVVNVPQHCSTPKSDMLAALQLPIQSQDHFPKLIASSVSLPFKSLKQLPGAFLRFKAVFELF